MKYKRRLCREAIQFGFAIAYDNGSRHRLNSRGEPWKTSQAAQRVLDRSSTYQARGGKVVTLVLVTYE
jgi:fructosamine-3-kinase